MRRAKHQPASQEERLRIMKSWSDKDDTEAAIVAAGFVEDQLGVAIKSRFVKLPATGDANKRLTEPVLFDGYGPLSSFFAKIDITYALGLCTNDARLDLHIIRSIRNDFAHTTEPTVLIRLTHTPTTSMGAERMSPYARAPRRCGYAAAVRWQQSPIPRFPA